MLKIVGQEVMQDLKQDAAHNSSNTNTVENFQNEILQVIRQEVTQNSKQDIVNKFLIQMTWKS